MPTLLQIEWGGPPGTVGRGWHTEHRPPAQTPPQWTNQGCTQSQCCPLLPHVLPLRQKCAARTAPPLRLPPPLRHTPLTQRHVQCLQGNAWLRTHVRWFMAHGMLVYVQTCSSYSGGRVCGVPQTNMQLVQWRESLRSASFALGEPTAAATARLCASAPTPSGTQSMDLSRSPTHSPVWNAI